MCPIYLSEQDVPELLTPLDAIAAVEESLRRLARGTVDNPPRVRVPIEDGAGEFAVMPSVDHELGYGGVKSYGWGRTPKGFAGGLFSPPARVAAGGAGGRGAERRG